MSKHIVIDPMNSRSGKTLVARRGIGGKYKVIAECKDRDAAISIVDKLNREE